MEYPAYALQRDGAAPVELVDGLDYRVTLNDGSECWMTLYNMRLQAADLGTHDKLGPVLFEEPPGDETATKGWGPVADAAWNGSGFVCPLLGSEPRQEVDAGGLAALIASLDADDLVQKLRGRYPSTNITHEAVEAHLAAAAEKIEVIEANVIELKGGALDELASPVKT